jgi:predicted RNase H-like HicB family nuclease
MPAVREWPKLLANVPKGAWVALSHDEEKVIAFGPDLREVLERAKQAGENDPIVIRVPQSEAAALL